MSQRVAFKQVDVFTSAPFNGNPLAVVLDASSLTDRQMAEIARWTNLSETTFVLPAEDAQADYRVRIFTVDGELPFAGHPTLGTAHALLEAGLQPKRAGELVQECAVGLVKLAIATDGSLAFAAPAAVMTPFASDRVGAALNSADIDEQRAMSVVDMGIRWLLIPMRSAEAVLAAQPQVGELAALLQEAGVSGAMPFGPLRDAAEQFEVRGLLVENGSLTEDPVTGSANACLARWLASQGHTADYAVRQGTRLGRNGRLQVRFEGDTIWIAGQTVTVIDGTIRL